MTGFFAQCSENTIGIVVAQEIRQFLLSVKASISYLKILTGQCLDLSSLIITHQTKVALTANIQNVEVLFFIFHGFCSRWKIINWWSWQLTLRFCICVFGPFAWVSFRGVTDVLWRFSRTHSGEWNSRRARGPFVQDAMLETYRTLSVGEMFSQSVLPVHSLCALGGSLHLFYLISSDAVFVSCHNLNPRA